MPKGLSCLAATSDPATKLNPQWTENIILDYLPILSILRNERGECSSEKNTDLDLW